MVFIILVLEVMGARSNVEKENFDGSQINQSRIWEKNEVEENKDETIAILDIRDRK